MPPRALSPPPPLPLPLRSCMLPSCASYAFGMPGLHSVLQRSNGLMSHTALALIDDRKIRSNACFPGQALLGCRGGIRGTTSRTAMLGVGMPAIEILLVEDNSADRELALRSLSRHGLSNHIIVCADGELAMQAVLRQGAFRDRGPLGLVLLDLHLPKINGF